MVTVVVGAFIGDEAEEDENKDEEEQDDEEELDDADDDNDEEFASLELVSSIFSKLFFADFGLLLSFVFREP